MLISRWPVTIDHRGMNSEKWKILIPRDFKIRFHSNPQGRSIAPVSAVLKSAATRALPEYEERFDLRGFRLGGGWRFKIDEIDRWCRRATVHLRRRTFQACGDPVGGSGPPWRKNAPQQVPPERTCDRVTATAAVKMEIPA
jgi:hypothetical protein